MNISVIGTGYVGLITGCGFAKLGHSVTCVDIDKSKVENINRGIPPIYERGLGELLGGLVGKNLKATLDLKGAVSGSEVVFIAVGTPSRDDGSIDLTYVEKAFKEVLSSMDSYGVIVVKSTVVPGTSDWLAVLGERELGKRDGVDYGLCMSPEFLREGMAVEDFFKPDRIVIGANDGKAMDSVLSLYSGFACQIIQTDRKTAEMIKYASNSMLATKISFANEVGNLCKKLSVDVYEVMDAVGMDKRICRSFLNAGIGFGGSCFPKDVKALVSSFKEHGIRPVLLEAVLWVNEKQPDMIVGIAKEKVGLKGRKVAVLGLAFKPDSDDMREAPSIRIIRRLLEEGAEVKVYDRKATENARGILGDTVSYASSLKEALAYSDIVFVLTDWDEFKDEGLYRGKLLFDGRKVLQAKSGEGYQGVCW